MSNRPINGLKGRLAAGIAAAGIAFALPSAGYAVGLIGSNAETVSALSALATSSDLVSFTPANADPRIARIVAERSQGKSRIMRFTPANTDQTPGRALTVAIRVDQQQARAISVRSAIEASKSQVASGGPVDIAPSRFNLGIAREIKSFAAPAPAISKSLSDAAIPDLSEFVPTPGVRKDPSRLGARIDFDEAAAARTQDQPIDRTIDAAASYRLTRNLDVTAGVRYEQDRSNRVSALPDLDQTGTQAVYVGTQFRF